ncbi:hypothetical protein VTO73DRAFT_5566 [Trametes versicolor]
MQTSFRYILSLAVMLAAALTVAQASPVPVSTPRAIVLPAPQTLTTHSLPRARTLQEPVERRDPYITVADW